MPIRITCPSCGRLGKAPDRCVGRTVECPACSRRYVLTAEMVIPEGLKVGEDGPSPNPARGPSMPPATGRPPAPQRRPESGTAHDPYSLDESDLEPPRRTIKPRPAPSRREESEDRPGGNALLVPALVGGAFGVVLLSILAAWVVVGKSHGPADVAVDPVPPKPAATPVVVAPAATAPSPAPFQPAVVPSPPAAPALASGSTPPPGFPSGGIPVSVAMQTSDVVAPEPEGESDVAARARSGAAAAASRDEGPGKTLSTADIVAESEPSVALVKGKASSGTGFLVGPGLLATNAHVIDEELIPNLEIRFVSADEKHKAPLRAELLYEDPERDLAFLAVKTDLKPLRVARTYAFRKGEDITIIGNPGIGDGQVLENAISRGVMSTKTQIENRSFYQLGVAINPGNSGGPVFDSSGRVIGVATLKASKQEATGFSIPIEDLQAALGKLATQSSRDADRYRSRHRITSAVKGLGGGGAVMCLMIDLRRAAAVSNKPEVKELLDKLEPTVAEMDKEAFSSLAAQAPRIRKDPLIAPNVKNMVSEMSENFTRIRGVYSAKRSVDDNTLRPWKQTHKRLIADLSSSLKLKFPEEMMVAFDDHTPSQPTILTQGPQNLGMYGSRLRSRFPNGAPGFPQRPGTFPRPPSIRDRMGRRGGFH